MFLIYSRLAIIVLLAFVTSQGCTSKNNAAVIATETVQPAPTTAPAPKANKPNRNKSFNPRKLVREVAEPYPLSNLNVNNNDTTYLQAVADYKNENWEEAFDKFFKMNPKTDQTLMYEASCKIQIGYYGHSRQILTTLLGVARGKTIEHAEWFMALSELGLNKRSYAIALLNKIKDNPAHLFSAQAADLVVRVPD